MTTHREQVSTGAVRRGVDGLGGPIGEPARLHMPPKMIHGVQLRRGFGQEAQLEVQLLGELETRLGQMRRTPVLEQDDVPPAPMGADHGQECLMRLLDPLLGNQQEELPTVNIEDAMEHPSRMRARDRHTDLLADPPLASIQRWGLGDNRLIQHQEDRPLPGGQTTLEPPFAWRHVAGRRARSCRGRFHRRPRRAMAKLTLGRETAR
jgi:hypothetical protein